MEQWQDELYRRFQLPFEIATNDKLEAARTGNWFLENDLVIARLDKSARDELVQPKLAAPECRWDLVVVDEAHKMSATFFGGEVKYTKRYKLGQLLSGLTEHLLLLTATARLPKPSRGAILHDIGKLAVPDEILRKPGPLSEEEWKVMRRHPVVRAEIVVPLSRLDRVIPLIRHHQERWDGTGCPDGLKGQEIPLEARILAVVMPTWP